ncbi:MAG: Sec translocon subunit SecG [Candidatus Westeberhardia cardiocondylae]|nr:Sec translocon subunit SecG [Candidatus Westeberhardia cardiocondylae]
MYEIILTIFLFDIICLVTFIMLQQGRSIGSGYSFNTNNSDIFLSSSYVSSFMNKVIIFCSLVFFCLVFY